MWRTALSMETRLRWPWDRTSTPGLEEVGEVELIGQGIDSLLSIRNVEHSCVEAEVFGGGEPTIKEGFVEDDANCGPDTGVVLGDVVTVDE